MKQKAEQENLVQSIFPPAIAAEMIASQSKDTSIDTTQSLRSIKSPNLGRTVARMHHQVTIFFSDIVGFTAMSQTCRPYEVMSFLHKLYVEFDELVDLDSQLWKVETIGDRPLSSCL